MTRQYPAVDTEISIHALLAESDRRLPPTPDHHQNFYPRSPCGERLLMGGLSCDDGRNFYPRSPCGERLFANFEGFFWWVISIHALLAESDLINTSHRIFGEGISIHALLAESDPSVLHNFRPLREFLSTLSLRRATSMLISLFCGC